jgi:Undecaprenyl-phosphate glucose phosphotransferase
MQTSKPRDDIVPMSILNSPKVSTSVAGACQSPETFDRSKCLIFARQGHAVREVISETEPPEACRLDTNRHLIPQEIGVDVGVRPVSAAIILGLLGVADGFAIFVSGVAPTLLPFLCDAVDWQVAGVTVVLGTILGINFLHLCGCYRLDAWHDFGGGLCQPVAGWLLTVIAAVAAIFAASEPTVGTSAWLMLWMVSGTLALLAIRWVLRSQISSWKTTGRLCKNVAVVGAGPIGKGLLRHFDAARDPLIRIVGVYDDRLSKLAPRIMGHTLQGTVDDLVNDVRRRRIDIVIVALPLAAAWRLSEVMKKLRLVPVDVRLAVDKFGFQLKDRSVSHLGGLTFLDAIDKPLRDWRWIAKDIEDWILSALILILAAPVMMIIALLIKLDSRGSVLFRQKRYGFNNQLIEVFKFRTMYRYASDPNGEQLTRREDPRITRIGAFLRRTSIDELPQFINVLRGEMSIVGPRPHATAAKADGLLYRDAVKAYDARHRVKPGITGWAQVNGWRGETETVEQITKRVEHDLYYIEHWSLLLDLRIIARTIPMALASRDAF